MEIIIRVFALYMFVWVVTRMLGKRELSQMSPFELVLLVTVGDLIQQGATQDDRSVTGAFLAVGTMAMVVLLTSWVTFRSRRARDAFEGLPSIVVRNGEPIPEALRLERVELDELLGAARAQGIRSLGDVDVAILEADGQFSFLLSRNDPGQQQHRPRPLDAS